jgi:hypothetical protein
MGESPEIPPGKSFTWRGKIYLLKNDPSELLRRYHADQIAWDIADGGSPKQAVAAR